MPCTAPTSRPGGPLPLFGLVRSLRYCSGALPRCGEAAPRRPFLEAAWRGLPLPVLLVRQRSPRAIAVNGGQRPPRTWFMPFRAILNVAVQRRAPGDGDSDGQLAVSPMGAADPVATPSAWHRRPFAWSQWSTCLLMLVSIPRPHARSMGPPCCDPNDPRPRICLGPAMVASMDGCYVGQRGGAASLGNLAWPGPLPEDGRNRAPPR